MTMGILEPPVEKTSSLVRIILTGLRVFWAKMAAIGSTVNIDFEPKEPPTCIEEINLTLEGGRPKAPQKCALEKNNNWRPDQIVNLPSPSTAAMQPCGSMAQA
jgi:hypothetical protein